QHVAYTVRAGKNLCATQHPSAQRLVGILDFRAHNEDALVLLDGRLRTDPRNPANKLALRKSICFQPHLLTWRHEADIFLGNGCLDHYWSHVCLFTKSFAP